MKSKIIFITFCLFISACSNNPYEDYLGLWETEEKSLWDGSTRIRIIEIRKDGETYIAYDNIESTSEPTQQVLSKQEGQLYINGNVPMGLSEDKEKLFFLKFTFKRIDTNRADQVKAEIAEKEAIAAAEREEKKRQREEKLKQQKLAFEQAAKERKEKRLAATKKRSKERQECNALNKKYKAEMYPLAVEFEATPLTTSANTSRRQQIMANGRTTNEKYRELQKNIPNCFSISPGFVMNKHAFKPR